VFGFTGVRDWVYPKKVEGTFTRIHHVTSILLHAFLFVVPFVRWNGEPIMLFEVASRRVYLFGRIYTSSDAILSLVAFLSAAFALFFFTAIFGRIWCGYVCPQSVFQIRWVHPIENFFEGSRVKRMRAAGEPMTAGRWARKIGKWSTFMLIAWLVSMAFMGFFVRTDLLWTGAGSWMNYAVVSFFTIVWFLDFAWFREQVCNYICPYARFQSALMDQDSLLISYEVERGEPRGGRGAKKEDRCFDCDRCVQVCPQGIDIRDGFQLECIACAKCIDACTEVKGKFGQATLVRYSTLDVDTGGKWRIFRTRTFVYGALLTALASVGAFKVATWEPVELQLQRLPGAMFVKDADGMIRNTFMLGVTDKVVGLGEREYTISAEGLPEGTQVDAATIDLVSAEEKKTPLIVRVPASKADRTVPFRVVVTTPDGREVVYPASFKGPGGI